MEEFSEGPMFHTGMMGILIDYLNMTIICDKNEVTTRCIRHQDVWLRTSLISANFVLPAILCETKNIKHMSQDVNSKR